MTEKRCFFLGTDRISKRELGALKSATVKAVRKIIREGVTEFHCAGGVGFETMAADCVAEEKITQEATRLIFEIPRIKENWITNRNEDLSRMAAAADELHYVGNAPAFFNALWVYGNYAKECSHVMVYRGKGRRLTEKERFVDTVMRNLNEKINIIYIDEK